MLKPNQTSGPDSKPEDEGTAKAREWLNKQALYLANERLLAEPSTMPDDHAIGITIGCICRMLAVFAESERSSAIKEAREECARAVCFMCGSDSDKWKPAEFIDDGWEHRLKSSSNLSAPCMAWQIRALGER